LLLLDLNLSPLNLDLLLRLLIGLLLDCR
jgi:hypothetical protein